MPIVMAAFPCLPFQKGEGYPSSAQKTLSLSFMLRCSPLNRQKDRLEGEKKGGRRKHVLGRGVKEEFKKACLGARRGQSAV